MSLRRLPTRLLLPLAAAAVLTTACSSAADPAPSAADQPARSASPTAPPPSPSVPAAEPDSTPSAETTTITIAEFAYDVPGPVAAGADLQVVNEDAEVHTFTLAGGPSVVVPGGETVQVTAPAQAGTYEISCDFHGGMLAELVVT